MDTTESERRKVTQVVARHYKNRFGEPCRAAEFVPSSSVQAIQIWKWDEQHSREDVCIYATLGASVTLIGDGRRCEFFVGLTPEVDDIASSLAETALHGVGTGAVPNTGDTVSLASPLWNGSAMHSFLFTDSGEAIIPPVSDDLKVEFIQMVPLFADEVSYKKMNGEEALWEVFRQKRVPYWNTRRASAFSGI